MDLYERYELFEAVRERGVKTVKAREKATGRNVLVHLAEGENDVIANALQSLAPEKRAQIVAQGEHGGKAYVVTEPGVGRFAEWIAAKSINPFTHTGKWDVTKPGMKPMSDAPPIDTPGEFTRMFQQPAAEGEPTIAMDPPPTPQPGAGEFTRMFSTPATPSEAAGGHPLAPPPPPPKGFVLTTVFDKDKSAAPPPHTPAAVP